MSGNVVGPPASTSNALARFNGETGRLLQNSSAVLLDSGNMLVSGAVVAANIPFVVGDVRGPGGVIDSCLARYDGTTGKKIKASSAFLDGAGNLSLTGTVVAANIPPGPLGDVTGPVSASNHGVACFDGLSGKLIECSTATISPEGDLLVEGSIAASNLPVPVGNVIGPGASTGNSLAIFANETGKAIAGSATTSTGSGALMLAGGSACSPAVSIPAPTPFGYYELYTAPIVSFSGPWAGTVAAALTLVRLGDRLVMLTLGAITAGALVATAIIEAVGAIPINFRPTATAKKQIPVVVNGAFGMGLVYIRVDGAIQIGADLAFTGAGPTAFTGLLGLSCGSMGTSIIYSA